MKKTLLHFILAFTFILTGSIFLVACGGSKTPPELSYISCDEVNHTMYDESSAQFNCAYGETIVIAKSDFTITAHYTDGSTESVTDFDLDTSEISAGATGTLSPGHYTVTITYSTATPLYIAVNVNTKTVDAATEAILDKLPWSIEIPYKEGDINILDHSELAPLKALLAKSDCPVKIKDGDKTTLKSEDVYYGYEGSFTVEAKDGYKLNSLQIYWTIGYGKVTFPSVKVDGKEYKFDNTRKEIEIEYDGNEHTMQFVFAEGTESLITVNGESYTTATAIFKQTNATDYYGNEYKLEIGSNYIFDSDFARGGSEDYVWFKIAKKPIERNFEVLGTYAYKGTAYTLADIQHNIDTELFDVEELDENCVNAARYFVHYSAKENTVLNYCWLDENGTTSNIESSRYSITLSIEKATLEFTQAQKALFKQHIVFRIGYDDDLTLQTVIYQSRDIDFDWLKSEEGAFAKFLTESITRFEAPEGNHDKYERPGTYNDVTVIYCPDDRNFKPANVEVTVVIEKIKVSVDRAHWHVEKGGEYVSSDSKIVYDGTAYNSLIGAGENNARSVRGDQVTVEFNYVHYYGTTENERNQPTLRAVNGGYYKTVAIPKIVKVNVMKNMEFDREITDTDEINEFYEVVTFEGSTYEWQIRKHNVTYGEWSLGFSYGSNNTVYLPAADKPLKASDIRFSLRTNEITATAKYYYSPTENGEYKEISTLPEFEDAGKFTKVGYYKAVVDNIVPENENNYNIQVEERYLELKWRFVTNRYDLTAANIIADGKTFSYGVALQDLFENVPDNIKITLPGSTISGIGNPDYWDSLKNDTPLMAGRYSVSKIVFVTENYDYYINTESGDRVYFTPSDDVEIINGTRQYEYPFISFYISPVYGKTFAFEGLKLLKGADKVEVTKAPAEEGLEKIYFELTAQINEYNAGKKAICSTEGGGELHLVKGDCAFVPDENGALQSFDDLLTTNPYYYRYYTSVDIHQRSSGSVDAGSQLLGNLSGDTLTLTMKIINPMDGKESDLVWQYTFTLVEE